MDAIILHADARRRGEASVMSRTSRKGEENPSSAPFSPVLLCAAPSAYAYHSLLLDPFPAAWICALAAGSAARPPDLRPHRWIRAAAASRPAAAVGTTRHAHAASNESPIVSSHQADAKSTLQLPSQVKSGWDGMLGRPSMADIVKMGRPQGQARPVIRSVATNTGMPIGAVSLSEVDCITTDKIPNGASEVHPASNDSSIDVLPTGEGLEVAESVATVKPGPLTVDINKDGGEEDTNFDGIKEMSASDSDGLTSSIPYNASGTKIQSEHTQIATSLNNDLIVETNDCQPDVTAFEHHHDSEGNMSITEKQFEQLTLREEKKSKSSEDNPAVIIPYHLQVSNVDCAHLTFGSFVSGTLDAPVSLKPANSDGEVAAVSDNHSIDQSDVRIHEHENKDTETPAADEHVTSTTKSDIENLDIMTVQQPELRTTDLINVTNNSVYNTSSTPDYATSNAVQPDSSAYTYVQENRQLQNISPLSSFMQGNIPDGPLPPALPPLREFDPAFSLLLTNPPLSTMIHGTPSSMCNVAVSTQPQEASRQLVADAMVDDSPYRLVASASRD
ncbi:hypothetical protein GUJ93_ZPchr0005g14923 [Zizania palustris]|uniref:Uncharacterized protein n=1 Tax=Zizania palustris TaxID=103762 RepID=A0A8J5S5G8_ZIZPA|nr:hypothetical protein GUJ93_ZPchr0005g14923 [Zizania palustris]